MSMSTLKKIGFGSGKTCLPLMALLGVSVTKDHTSTLARLAEIWGTSIIIFRVDNENFSKAVIRTS